ncbi:glycosyltransferase [Vibrio fluvialis]|nr:glycosyltransferase [Vibrio fluvialis]
MKVLHVYRTCHPITEGGVEQVIRCICRGTKKLGVTNKILSLSDSKSEIIYSEGTEIILCKKNWEISSNGFSMELFKQYAKLSQWADIIHFHYPWPTGDLLFFTSPKKPKIVTYHSDIVKQNFLKLFYRPIECQFLKNVTSIVATSPQYMNSSENLNKYKHKTNIIPLSVDPDDYHFNGNYNINNLGNDFFLFIGVLRYYKGLHYLLSAAKETEGNFVIAGDGPMMEELRNRIQIENISNVHLLGFVTNEEKLELLKRCKAFIFPSHLRSEAFGVSLLEAQISKKPIISCDIGTGSSYVNIHNETGLVVKPASVSDLSDAIKKLLYNEELCNIFGQNGYNRAMKLFTIEKQAKSYVKLYRSILKDR